MPEKVSVNSGGSMRVRYEFNPTQSRMIASEKPVVVCIGPQGEGKSYGALGALVAHTFAHKAPIRGLVVRDKHTNIKRTTVRTAEKFFGKMCQFTEDFHRMNALGGRIRMDMMGIDDYGALTALQGGEWHFAWLEEPAPIIDVGNAGVREEVFDVLLTRGPREPGAFHKVIVTMNPADEDHWTYKRFLEDPDPSFDVLNIPYGENTFLPTDEREKTKRAYAHRPELYQRYVQGRFSSVYSGVAVTPEYNEVLHRAQTVLDPMPNITTYRFWDGGLNPSCVIGQITPKGRFLCLESLRGDNIGMKQFIQTQVKPTLTARYKGITKWRDLGDPMLGTSEQSDSSATAAQIIQEELQTSYEGGEAGWDVRREAIKELLTRLADSQPMFVMSRHCVALHRALKGGWHYHQDASGKVINTLPVKDIHSHLPDALSHGIARIFRYQQDTQNTRYVPKNVGKTYAPKNLYEKAILGGRT